MPIYTSQTLYVGNEPVGFNIDDLNETSLKRPQSAFGIVEGNEIRVSSIGTPTKTEGLIAPVGSTITITTENDIENFKAITTSVDSIETATIYFEFSNSLDD